MNPFWPENIIKDYRGTYLRCKNCNAETKIHDPENVVVFFCPKCQWLHAKETADYNKLNKHKKAVISPCIPLESKGIINDINYTVIGCANKYEKRDKNAKWEEYTLLDDKGGYAFLSQSFGHWVYLKECSLPPSFNPKKNSFTDDANNDFELYSSYYQATNSATGEFQHDVIAVKTRYTKEFISPPLLFSYELDGAKATYFTGNYMSRSKISKCFKNVSLTLPFRDGIGSCQPFYFGIKPKKFLSLSIIFLILSLPVWLLLESSVSTQPLVSTTGHLSDTIKTQQLVSAPFDISGANNSLLRIDSQSNVDNDWIEAEVTLVNENTGEEKTLVSGLEYYHGFDDEGSWSEGSLSNSNYFESIKPGTYHLEGNLSGAPSRRYANFELRVFKDSPTTWNYILLAISLGVICFLVNYTGNLFENKRLGITNDD